jgi:hypothetical protein
MAQARPLSALVLLLAGVLPVCLGQQFHWDSTNAAATVVRLTGQVSVERDAHDVRALDVGSMIKPQQVIFTGPDGYAEFRVADGSTFEIFPNSRVTFRNHPGSWEDLLEMLLGRVKVHIQKLNGQPNHNRVNTPTAIISVRGTVFDVQVDEDQNSTLVAVDEGQVQVQHRLLGGQSRVLNPGESLRVYRSVPLAQRMIDKSTVVRGALRAAAEAVYTTLSRTPRASGGGVPSGGGGGGGVPGDHGGKNPPPSEPSGGTQPPSDAGPNAPPPPTP